MGVFTCGNTFCPRHTCLNHIKNAAHGLRLLLLLLFAWAALGGAAAAAVFTAEMSFEQTRAVAVRAKVEFACFYHQVAAKVGQ